MDRLPEEVTAAILEVGQLELSEELRVEGKEESKFRRQRPELMFGDFCLRVSARLAVR
jgi:hypothetical protein